MILKWKDDFEVGHGVEGAVKVFLRREDLRGKKQNMENSNRSFALKKELIPLSKVLKHPYLCPHCLGSTVVIEGYYRRAVKQVREQGKDPVDRLAGQIDLDIQSIACRQCEVRYLITDEITYAQQQTIMNLREEIGLLRGTYQKGSAKIN